jgi:hypothetical protein
MIAQMDTRNIIIVLTLTTLLFAIVRYKKTIALPLFMALILSTAWTSIYRYEYIGENIFLFDRINIYPLALWTCGLTGIYILQQKIGKKQNFILATILYCILLVSLEAFGYYFLDIRLATHYTSLWNTGIIHGPAYLKLFYILAGPAYLLILKKITSRHSM